MNAELEPDEISPRELQRRTRWAERRGTPAWLWPQIPVEAWREALAAIETAVRSALSGKTGHRLEGDPQAIGLACYTSGVGPLLGWWRSEGLIEAGAPVAAVLDLHLAHNRDRSTRMEAAAIAIVEALGSRGAAVAVLKGMHTGHDYFPDPATRPASDIDLLIDPGASEQAEAALAEADYELASRSRFESSWRLRGAPTHPRSLDLVHRDDPWSIDLHRSLNVMVSAGAPIAKLDAASPMSSNRRWTPSSAALTLEQPLLLLHLAVHAGGGLQNLTLLRLVELALVIRRDVASGQLSWEAFVELGRRTGALGYAWPALKLCEDLAPGTLPESILADLAAAAPAAVRRVVGKLTPATAQRVDRASLAEHFMWAEGLGARLRQAAFDVVPAGSLSQLLPLYRRRLWQLLRGRLSR